MAWHRTARNLDRPKRQVIEGSTFYLALILATMFHSLSSRRTYKD